MRSEGECNNKCMYNIDRNQPTWYDNGQESLGTLVLPDLFILRPISSLRTNSNKYYPPAQLQPASNAQHRRYTYLILSQLYDCMSHD